MVPLEGGGWRKRPTTPQVAFGVFIRGIIEEVWVVENDDAFAACISESGSISLRDVRRLARQAAWRREDNKLL